MIRRRTKLMASTHVNPSRKCHSYAVLSQPNHTLVRIQVSRGRVLELKLIIAGACEGRQAHSNAQLLQRLPTVYALTDFYLHEHY